MNCLKWLLFSLLGTLGLLLVGCGGGGGGVSDGDCSYTECGELETVIGSVSYAVYQPENIADDSPLLVLFPGATASYSQIEVTYRARSFADSYGYTLLLAQSPDRYWPYNSNGTAAVIQLLDQVQASYSLNEQVFLAGISNGSVLSNVVACDYADRITGIFSASGQMFHDEDDGYYGFCQPNDSVAIAYVHGTADRDIFYSGGGSYMGRVYESRPVRDAFYFWREHNQCGDEFVTEQLPELELGRSATTEFAQGCNVPVQFTISQYGVHVPNWQSNALHNLMQTFFVAAATAKFG